ncbi:response regulator [Rugamonas sp.]|uniref:response regulator n=1 Tax=Rugamonas sp. TaxID=1926287 RepID=UPI0025E17BA8|nr:response regulator [Rugamonas sp.]
MPPTTILIVDDSRVSRLMARQYILGRHADWVVDEAGSGEEALARIAAATEDGVAGPDLVLMDVNMPGMGGIAAAEQLRRLAPALKIALLTANVQRATRERAAELGIGFMEKPITAERIAQLLAVLEGPPCSS